MARRAVVAPVLVLVLVLVLALALTQTARTEPLSPEALFSNVESYAGFGAHRTGSEGDRKTTAWLRSQLSQIGFAVETQTFSLSQFFPAEQTLTLGEQTLEIFPHWFPHPLMHALQAPLADFQAPSLAGRIAYIAPGTAGPWYQLQPAQLAAQAAARGALALLIAPPHPSKEIYATNAAAPHLQQPLPIPTVIAAARDHDRIQMALSLGVRAQLRSEGETRQVKASNLLARYPSQARPDLPWMVISTPTSGWFTCAGERGGGVALWLEMARWVVQHEAGNYNWLFVANTGHELGFMGAHHSLPSMPPPGDVHMWLHLGASIGARQWQEQGGQLTPLPRVHAFNRLYSDPALTPLINTAFASVPDLEVLPISALNRKHSELGNIVAAGYRAMGFVGSHRFFHTPADTPAVTDSALLAPYGRALRALLSLQKAPYD